MLERMTNDPTISFICAFIPYCSDNVNFADLLLHKAGQLGAICMRSGCLVHIIARQNLYTIW